MVRSPRTAAITAALLLAGCCASAGIAHAEPAPPPPPGPKTTIDADGTYAVGKDIQPGTYASAGPVGDGACYWKRVNGADIIDNGLTKKPQVIQIAATDTAFTTNECQAWQLTDAPLPPQAGALEVLGQLGQLLARPPAPPPGS
jgi:hypothetical protein